MTRELPGALFSLLVLMCATAVAQPKADSVPGEVASWIQAYATSLKSPEGVVPDYYPDGTRVTEGTIDGKPSAAAVFTLESFEGGNNYTQFLAVFWKQSDHYAFCCVSRVGGKGVASVGGVAFAGNHLLVSGNDYTPDDPMSHPSKPYVQSIALIGTQLTPIATATANELTLCDEHETTVFSCGVSRAATDSEHSRIMPRRVISLCASPDFTAASGRLTYRFGADKQHIQLTYPEDGRLASRAFTSEFDSAAKGSWWEVTFTRGLYSYTVYNRLASYEENSRSNGGGVRVSRRGKLVSDLWCDGDEHSPAIEDQMGGIVQNLPEDVPAEAKPTSTVRQTQGRWVSEASPLGNSLGSLCEALVKRLNYLPGDCAKDALESYPEFSPPPWQEVDTQSHTQLVAAVLAHSAGPFPFFREKPEPDLARVARAVQDFISAGGEIRSWRTRLLDYYVPGPGRPPAPPGDQTVVMMVDKRYVKDAPRPDPEACPGDSSKGWIRSTYIAQPDLSGLDSRVDTSQAMKLAGSYPVIYKGQTLLIRFPVLGTYTIAYVEPTRGPGGFCSFKLKDRP